MFLNILSNTKVLGGCKGGLLLGVMFLNVILFVTVSTQDKWRPLLTKISHPHRACRHGTGLVDHWVC